MLKNAPTLAIVAVDTAENEPPKVCERPRKNSIQNTAGIRRGRQRDARKPPRAAQLAADRGQGAPRPLLSLQRPERPRAPSIHRHRASCHRVGRQGAYRSFK